MKKIEFSNHDLVRIQAAIDSESLLLDALMIFAPKDRLEEYRNSLVLGSISSETAMLETATRHPGVYKLGYSAVMRRVERRLAAFEEIRSSILNA